MPQTTEISADALSALHEALQAIPETERFYVTRFIAGRVDQPIEAVLEEFGREWSDRSEAARLEEHRKERVTGEFLETVPADKRDAIIQILGVGATASEGNPGTDVRADL